MVATLFNSCNKFDVRSGIELNNKDVFALAPSSLKALQKIVAELKRQNALTGFMKDFVAKEGYPLWEKSIYQKIEKNTPPVFNARGGEESADTVVYTPIALLDSNFVNGFLLSKVFGDSVELHLYRANDFDLYPYGKVDGSMVTAERITLTLMELEKNIYGQRKYKVLDSNLFKVYKSDTLVLPSVATVELINTSGHLKVFNYCVRMRKVSKCNCEDKSNCDYNQGCNTCGYDFCFSIGSEDPPLGGGSGGSGNTNWPPDPPTSYPVGGGGNNPPPPNNCTGVNECRPGSQIVEGKVPCGGCGSGPIVMIPPENHNYFNPYNADEVILDSSLNNYPCVKRIIDSLTNYANINALAQVALNQVFGVNQRIKLTVKVDHNLPFETDGTTEPGNINSMDSVYSTSIHLNKWMLDHSTQEYIAATIIHEAMHAYIRFCQHQVQNNYMDTTTFKNLFPLYWPPNVAYYGSSANYYSIGASVQHQVISSNLISIMTESLVNLFPNNNIRATLRDSIYTGISWGGLQGTPSFYAHPDTMFIHAANIIAKDTSIHAPFLLNGVIYNLDANNLNLTKTCH